MGWHLRTTALAAIPPINLINTKTFGHFDGFVFEPSQIGSPIATAFGTYHHRPRTAL
jgi:hypothetical protein